MTTKGFLLIFCLLSFFQKTYAQSKIQISVLNTCVDYMLEKENIELLYVRNPSIESFCKADLRRNYINYKLPFDSLEFLRIRNIGHQDIKGMWPRLNLKRTIKLSEIQLDSLRKVNLLNYKKKFGTSDSTNVLGLIFNKCLTFSNPVFTKNKKYTIVRIIDYSYAGGFIEYKYLLLEGINEKWTVLKELPGETLCGK